jgi:hypothetical protein
MVVTTLRLLRLCAWQHAQTELGEMLLGHCHNEYNSSKTCFCGVACIRDDANIEIQLSKLLEGISSRIRLKVR